MNKFFIFCFAAAAWAQTAYLLGPGDQVAVSVRDRKEIEIKPAAIGLDGNVELAYAGKIHAEGLSTQQLAREVETRLTRIVLNPMVTVEVSEYGSQPVSVLGAVNRPGVQQLRGNKNLIEVLSLVEGLKPEAGNTIKITRPKSSGPLPLANAKDDPSGQFSIAEVKVKGLMDASAPESNIPIRAHDVITVPRAELIYVMGKVRKPGGFPLNERESMTVLQAISLAEGVDAAAATQSARILRSNGSAPGAVEIPIDVKKILANAAPDQPLQPNDILFLPSSATKSVGVKVLEAGLQMATGVVIWGR
ncbi:MAG: polysaccharide biosynthesis/export family protein [Acidobacteriia bacterium]|nr:polysaccharide biosynthesis/export family protein [Terriglobia bacterium]